MTLPRLPRLALNLRVGLLLLVLISLAGGGCETFSGSHGADTDPSDISPTTEDLHVGDKVVVTISDIGSVQPIINEQTIPEDGEITLHLNLKIKALGKTRGQLQKEIYDLYVPKYYLRMTVTIKQEERWFYVQGEVRSNSRYPYSGEVTVLKAITAAGGFTDFADRSKVRLIRANGKIYTINCNKAKSNPDLDRKLYPNDRVDVPRRWY
jgi:protein involved in polysaccharide export with SLBB domain